jgi:hypothetical protein
MPPYTSKLEKYPPGLYTANDFQESFMTKAWNPVPLTKDELLGFVVVGGDRKQSMVEWRRANIFGKSRRIETHILWCEVYEEAFAAFLRFR